MKIAASWSMPDAEAVVARDAVVVGVDLGAHAVLGLAEHRHAVDVDVHVRVAAGVMPGGNRSAMRSGSVRYTICSFGHPAISPGSDGGSHGTRLTRAPAARQCVGLATRRSHARQVMAGRPARGVAAVVAHARNPDGGRADDREPAGVARRRRPPPGAPRPGLHASWTAATSDHGKATGEDGVVDHHRGRCERHAGDLGAVADAQRRCEPVQALHLHPANGTEAVARGRAPARARRRASGSSPAASDRYAAAAVMPSAPAAPGESAATGSAASNHSSTRTTGVRRRTAPPIPTSARTARRRPSPRAGPTPRRRRRATRVRSSARWRCRSTSRTFRGCAPGTRGTSRRRPRDAGDRRCDEDPSSTGSSVRPHPPCSDGMASARRCGRPGGACSLRSPHGCSGRDASGSC